MLSKNKRMGDVNDYEEYARAWKGWSRNVVPFHVRMSCLVSLCGQEFHKAYVCGVI